jgi:hypothetical protein
VRPDPRAWRRVRVTLRACCQCCLLLLLAQATVYAQETPDVSCQAEKYELSPGNEVQAVVLRDPSGEQQAEFDLTDGASLVSLRYRGKELLYGHSEGANVEMYQIRHGTEQALKGVSPYWSAFNPDQAERSMDVPSTVAGIACDGQKWMNAFAMMVEAGADNSFQRRPLLGVWKGRLSGYFPPGYSSRYTIETEASWVPNAGGTPKYYLRLEQTVVNIAAADSGTLHWLLLGSVPWSFDHWAGDPASCMEKTPCETRATPVISAGRYEDAAHTEGVAVVVPTEAWGETPVYQQGSGNPEDGAPNERKRDFGIALTHALAGAADIEFQWYICAGSWSEARAFARKLAH